MYFYIRDNNDTSDSVKYVVIEALCLDEALAKLSRYANYCFTPFDVEECKEQNWVNKWNISSSEKVSSIQEYCVLRCKIDTMKIDLLYGNGTCIKIKHTARNSASVKNTTYE